MQMENASVSTLYSPGQGQSQEDPGTDTQIHDRKPPICPTSSRLKGNVDRLLDIDFDSVFSESDDSEDSNSTTEAKAIEGSKLDEVNSKVNDQLAIHDADLVKNGVALLKSNTAAMSAIKSLMELEGKESIRRFMRRADPTKVPSKAGSCYRVKKQDEGPSLPYSRRDRRSTACGPFQSCPMRHSKSLDFEKSGDALRSSEELGKGEKKDSWGKWDWSQDSILSLFRGTSQVHGHGSISSSRSGSDAKNRCYNCAHSSVYLSDPDLWYDDYKAQITYERIPKIYKIKLREKLANWMSSDDFKEELHWARSTNGDLNRMPMHSGYRVIAQRINSNTETHPSLRTGYLPTPRYGPSAIASVSGIKENKTIIRTPRPRSRQSNSKEVIHALPRFQNKTGGTNSGRKEVDLEEKIPWPSDNVRYYDDDSNPMLLEVLAKAPCIVPTDLHGPPKGGTSSRISSLFSRKQQDPHQNEILKALGPSSRRLPVDYVIGAAPGPESNEKAKDNKEAIKPTTTGAGKNGLVPVKTLSGRVSVSNPGSETISTQRARTTGDKSLLRFNNILNTQAWKNAVSSASQQPSAQEKRPTRSLSTTTNHGLALSPRASTARADNRRRSRRSRKTPRAKGSSTAVLSPTPRSRNKKIVAETASNNTAKTNAAGSSSFQSPKRSMTNLAFSRKTSSSAVKKVPKFSQPISTLRPSTPRSKDKVKLFDD